jgi:putative membrane protein
MKEEPMRHRSSIPFLLLAFALMALLAFRQGFLSLLAFFLFTIGIYFLGLARLWRRAGLGHGVPAWRAACFIVGIIILALALSNPMDELADRAFSMHMVQHMLLIKIIAPLLLLGEFTSVFLWAVGNKAAHRLGAGWKRSRWAGTLWQRLTHPWTAWILFTLCLWIWHIPTFYQIALKNELIHDVEHLMFLGTSLLFWWYLLQKGSDHRTRYGMVVLYLFAALMQESALGALLTFSSASWYSSYASAALWGLSPLVNQQLAGVIMWLPGGIFFMLLIVLYFGQWLQAIEKSQPGHPSRLAQTGDPNE